VSIEDDLFHAFKYAGFGQKIDPTAMIRMILRNLEITMLSQMDARIRARLSELQGAPQDTSMDPFSILGVDMSATREEVDKAYREKAKSVHPDVGGSNIEMAKINAAYEAIRLFKGWKEK
jgi:DnaJ-domain-containing protein 1